MGGSSDHPSPPGGGLCARFRRFFCGWAGGEFGPRLADVPAQQFAQDSGAVTGTDQEAEGLPLCGVGAEWPAGVLVAAFWLLGHGATVTERMSTRQRGTGFGGCLFLVAVDVHYR